MTSNVPTNITGQLAVNKVPTDFFVSGALFTSLISGNANYQKYKKEELGKDEALKNTIKTATQAGLASASAIASVQYLANKSYLKATLALAVGAGGVFGIEKFCQNKQEKNKG